MASSFHKIYGLAVHTKTQGRPFQIYPLWDQLKKIAVSHTQNAGVVPIMHPLIEIADCLILCFFL